jgi:beta-lactamase class A
MRDFSVHRTPQNYPKKKLKVIVIIFLAILVIPAIFNFLPKKSKQNTPLPIDINNNPIKIIKPTAKKMTSSKELLQEIEVLLRKNEGTYSVYIYDLKTNTGFGVNEEMVLTAASVNKIPILAALYYLAGKNEIDLEKTITLQEKDIQDYGTGSIRYDPVGSVYSLKTLARLMMEQSDNTAAYLLGTPIIGFKKIQNLIESWELRQTSMNDNKTSAKDMSILLTKMYRGEITNKALTSEMLTFMDKTDFDDRIPAGLPEGIKYYHKTGDEVGKVHDVGIIDIPDHPYYLGILTTDSTNEENTKKSLSEISKLVYEYMSKL